MAKIPLSPLHDQAFYFYAPKSTSILVPSLHELSEVSWHVPGSQVDFPGSELTTLIAGFPFPPLGSIPFDASEGGNN